MTKHGLEASQFSHSYPINKQGYDNYVVGQPGRDNDKLSAKKFISHRYILCQSITWVACSIEEQATRKAVTCS